MDDANKAKKALAGAGLAYVEGTLEEFEMANKPGALAELAGKLAKKGTNIECAYATVHRSAKKAVVVLGTSKPGGRVRGLAATVWAEHHPEIVNGTRTMKHLTKLEKAVSAWPRVWVRPHRFGGREFGLGSAELGHVHTGGIVDIPFPPRIKEALLAEGLAEEHRWAPDSGWVTFRVRREQDLQHALWLMRLSYLRYMLKVASDPLQLLETESEQLRLTPRFKSLLEPFVPKNTQTADVPSADTASAD